MDCQLPYINVDQLIAAYYKNRPDPSLAAQRVRFGTSGHRGSAFDCTFNEAHVLAITQAICNYRKRNGINGPLFLGADTHALSPPAVQTVLEVLAANDVEVMISYDDEFTPTPVISHAIIGYNRGRVSVLADGIVVTPSHNPPRDGGIKYNAVHGGPASSIVTTLIEAEANRTLTNKFAGLRRMPYEQAIKSETTHRHDYLRAYIPDLANIVNMSVIRDSKIRIGVDPLGGAGVHYWPAIAEHYKIDLTVINKVVDATFSFMPLDWDGKIRMDPSSSDAMQKVISCKDRFDICFACDPDHDRHGIVTPFSSLLPANHYQVVALNYLLENRPLWGHDLEIGKSVVSTQMIERVAQCAGIAVYEVPVGFKWYAEGLIDEKLAFCSEESAGATFLRMDKTVWTTDKDGIACGLLAAEILAATATDLGHLYTALEKKFNRFFFKRVDTATTAQTKQSLEKLLVKQVASGTLAGDPILKTLNRAPGNGELLQGIKVITKNGWFAARSSGTEPIYKIYAESFCSEEHLDLLIKEAQNLIHI
jgi:phosphoglucomutase